MKTFILVLLIALVLPEEAYTQTPLSHTIPVRGSQSIEMHFDYPELIRVSTWDGPSIEITGTVSINGGENDDAFIVEHERVGDVVKVHSRVSNIKQLPHRITVRDGEKTIMFRDKAALKEYQPTHRNRINSIAYL